MQLNKKRYETELNEYKKRKREAESMALLGMSLGILAGSGNQDSGVGTAPVAPPMPSNEFRRYSLPNGKIMQCNTFGSNTQCF